MNIVVTGGSGRIGRYVVRELVEAGHSVTNADLTKADNIPGGFLQVDLTSAGDVYQVLARSKAEAVVHLGAWANAGVVPDTRTYGDNVQGTFNIFQACADLGIKRVINASSAQVYGFAAAPPVFLPADETHPLRPDNSYALSKVVSEQAAYYFIAKYGLEILSFRFMGVRTPGQLPGEIEALKRDPSTGGRLLWTRTDSRDAAIACRLAVEAPQVAPGPYNMTGGVVLAEGAEALVGRYFGDNTETHGDLSAHASPLSCARARVEFGYEPRFLWSESQSHPEI